MQGQRPLASRVPLRRLILLLASSVTPHSPAAHLAQSLCCSRFCALSRARSLPFTSLILSLALFLILSLSLFRLPFPLSLFVSFSLSFPFACRHKAPAARTKKASYSTQFGIETNRSRRGSKQRIAPHASHVGRHPCPYCCSHFPQSFSRTCPLASFLFNCGFCIPVSEPSETPSCG
jgi:hypothetical protein